MSRQNMEHSKVLSLDISWASSTYTASPHTRREEINEIS